jgi:hypothetical protein
MGHKRIVLELSEHEALRLLDLIKQKIETDDKVWRPYWERQAQNIQHSLERASTEENYEQRD